MSHILGKALGSTCIDRLAWTWNVWQNLNGGFKFELYNVPTYKVKQIMNHIVL